LLSLEGVDGKKFAAPIQDLISQHAPRFIPLVNQDGYEDAKKDLNWRIYINEEIELDL